MSPPLGPSLPPERPQVLSPEESAEILKLVCREIVLEAERDGKDLSDFAPGCYRKYGRGALCLHFGSLEEAKQKQQLTVRAWLERSLRRSASYGLPADSPVPEKVMDAARAFSCDCAEGALGSRVLFRRAARLLEQLPEGASDESRQALQSYDPGTEVCVCGEVLGKGADEVFMVAGRLPLETFAERQREQRRRWQATREHVARLKTWGNEELSDKEVGTELAAKTYREGLRILEEAEMEDAGLELPLRLNLAEALARMGQWGPSAEESGRALELEPGSVKALYRRGRARLKLGELELARADLIRAARAAPQDRAIREALEAAKASVAPAAAAEPGSGPEEPGAPVTKWSASRAAAAVGRHLARAAPAAWRQSLFCIMAVLLLGLLGRRRRRALQQSSPGSLASRLRSLLF